MATKGRKPKPASVHLLNGNPSKASLEKRFEKELNATKLALNHPPTAPKWLDQEAAAEWDRIIPLLIQMNVATELDLKAVEMYCKCYSRWKRAEMEMDDLDSTVMQTGKDGTYLQQLPQVSIAQKYMKICRDWMSEFGLTPAARARGIKQDNPDQVDVDDDIFKGLL